MSQIISANPASIKDVYKEAHIPAVKRAADAAYTTFTNRFAKHANTLNKKYVVNFGLQRYILDYLLGDWQRNFFSLPKEDAVATHGALMETIVPGGDYKYLEDLHDLGYLPLEIKALPEGVLVPYGVPPITMKSTLSDFAWLGQGLETVTSTEVWPMQTSATTGYQYLATAYLFAKKTGYPVEAIRYAAHDFSLRGAFGRFAGSMIGLAHIAVGNVGTDNVPGVLEAREYYGANLTEEEVGKSIRATEHFVMAMGGGDDDSIDFYKELLLEVYPDLDVSVVSDTKDYWRVIAKYLPELKDIILSREGFTCFRPDSGIPFRVLCGYLDDEVVEHKGQWYLREDIVGNPGEDDVFINVDARPMCRAEKMGTVRMMDEIFGHTLTDKGYRVLHEKINVLYGDSISPQLQYDIYERLMEMGYAPKPVLGVGSFSYQYVTRDTHGSAFKGTAVIRKGQDEWVGISKNPKTDTSKKSQHGLVQVKLVDGEYVWKDHATAEEEEDSELKTVFKDGELLIRHTFKEIRESLWAQLDKYCEGFDVTNAAEKAASE